MRHLFFILLLSVGPLRYLSGQASGPDLRFDWRELPAMPPPPGADRQPGVAGAFIGVHNDALIIAGGANFPDGPAWEGGTKVFHADIYILMKTGKDRYEWSTAGPYALGRKIGYGLSVPTEDGLVCIGGEDGTGTYAEVFRLSWDRQRQVLRTDTLPSIPVPLANLAGARLGRHIYVAGSTENDHGKYFWRLDPSGPSATWEALPPWPGPARTHAFGGVQHNGSGERFYLLKGRYREKNGISTLHADGYAYDPETQGWTPVDEGPDTGEGPFRRAAGTMLPAGSNHLLLLGGAAGPLHNRLEQLAVSIDTTRSEPLRGSLVRHRDSLMRNHPGFSRDIWAYHAITDTWTLAGQLPPNSPVTTTAVRWDDQLVIPTGEVSPCIRTPTILRGAMTDTVRFGTLNYLVLVLYLLLLVWLGVVLSRRQQSTDDFFKGGNRIPWWAAGLSIFGTQLSAITFMAIPSKTFATNWLYFFLMMTILLVSPFIIRYFLPFYRRFNLTTAYEYLELRFNLATRLIGSLLYLVLQVGRMGIVLLLPSLALSVVTGFDVHACILTMGLLSILYTVLGGIEAVIWTDVLQVVVLLGGSVLSLLLLAFSLEGSDVAGILHQYDKLRFLDLSPDLFEPTLWVVLLGGFASNIIQYGSDQTVIQRYLTTKDERSAANGIRTGAWLTLPATLIFFSLGTLLFVHYKVHPDMLNPTLPTTDAIFPWYIVSNLPDGVVGLLIAAIFAASMSSLDSSMNSAATVVTTDFYRRLQPARSEAAFLRLARRITLVAGILGTGLALLMATWGVSSLWDQFNMIVGLFAGGLGGVFLLGIFSRRANGTGAIIGLAASGIVQYLIKEHTPVHLLLYAFTGMFTAVIIGYLTSRLVGRTDSRQQQFTYFAIRHPQKRPPDLPGQ